MSGDRAADGELDVPPDPAALIESMRAFGYSLPTAVADLIDNSISAGARSIDVEFDWDGANSTLAVVDDGGGMDERTLTEAMRLGTRSPVEERAPTDLGRFGLGLKSAAWSQARSLTVLEDPRRVRRDAALGPRSRHDDEALVVASVNHAGGRRSWPSGLQARGAGRSCYSNAQIGWLEPREPMTMPRANASWHRSAAHPIIWQWCSTGSLPAEIRSAYA